MLPLGGTREIGSHKGFGLAMLVEILCGVLTGTGGGPFRRQGTAHYFMAYDVGAFCDVATLKRHGRLLTSITRLQACAW